MMAPSNSQAFIPTLSKLQRWNTELKKELACKIECSDLRALIVELLTSAFRESILRLNECIFWSAASLFDIRTSDGFHCPSAGSISLR
jgi:hypothetical protein